METEYDQYKVLYQNSPKEVNTKRGMPRSKQFGGNKMPQDEHTHSVSKGEVKKMIKKSEKEDRRHDEELMEKHVKMMHKGESRGSHRHKEHR